MAFLENAIISRSRFVNVTVKNGETIGLVYTFYGISIAYGLFDAESWFIYKS